MCVQEGNLQHMRETDPGYLWIPNGEQVSWLRYHNGSQAGLCLDSESLICILVLRLNVYV